MQNVLHFTIYFIVFWTIKN